MELKRFQHGILRETRRFLTALAGERRRGPGNRHASLDAWRAVLPGRPYAERQDGMGRDLPDFWVKVPTGGGKTLLATQILGQVFGTLLSDRNGTGLVLWIVPSDQIYRDTLRALRDRDHAYRVALEAAVGRRVEVWEKHEATRLRPAKLREDLNVLLLKFPSANRLDRDTLRLFQDAGGNIVEHFPPEDDPEAQKRLEERVPNLEMVGEGLVRTSVGNLIRLCEPPVVLDEGHKALSDLARQTLAGFNPAMLVQLSATPPRDANVLAQATGQELLAEEMIKLPINVVTSGETNWRVVVDKAEERRKRLARRASRLPGNLARIRPIVLVQVERTGKGQRSSGHIHVEDVKSHLLGLGVPEAAIRVKSSERDDMEGEDLLAEGCPVTWILTKSALQEGWDCPYAYVLVSLANVGAARAMTQLVGRVLRQPLTRRTGDPELDESYVYCLKQRAADAIAEVKRALEREGYEGSEASVVDRSGGGDPARRPTVKIRPRFRRLYREFEGKVYLPRFCLRDGRTWRALDYHLDLLSQADPRAFDVSGATWSLEREADEARDRWYRVGLGQDAPRSVEQQVEPVESDDQTVSWLTANLSLEHFSWRQAQGLVSTLVRHVLGREPSLRGRLALVRHTLRERILGLVEAQTDVATERAFLDLIAADRIALYMECRECRFELPPEVEVRTTRRLSDDRNAPVRKSLFEWAEEAAFNEYERAVALWLDDHPEVLWWYRNAVGPECFAIQGYRRGRVYPDFIVQGAQGDGRGRPRPVVYLVEAKGAHLAGSEDTTYKRDLAAPFERVGRKVTWQRLGKGFENSTFRFQVIDQGSRDAWRDRLAALFAGR